jgi:hypothetical protein
VDTKQLETAIRSLEEEKKRVFESYVKHGFITGEEAKKRISKIEKQLSGLESELQLATNEELAATEQEQLLKNLKKLGTQLKTKLKRMRGKTSRRSDTPEPNTAMSSLFA